MNNSSKNMILWLLIGVILFTLLQMMQPPQTGGESREVSYSDFLHQVEQGNVQDVLIEGDRAITATLVSTTSGEGLKLITYAPADNRLIEILREHNVAIEAKPEARESTSVGAMLFSWLPLLIMFAIFIFFMRQMNQAGGKAMGFGKSRARLMTEAQGRVTFEDVAGIEEAKEELQEVVDFLRDPGKFQRLGGKIPKGCLLVGPPGTGKTLLARAVAGEANVPFFTISGSDFVEMFVGVGASRVRDMFEQGKKNAPCIIFIDEIDAVGRHRGAGLGGGNDEREQTLNQLLVEMDGFEANEGVILLAATNRPDVLDPALLRPGRFDRQVVVPRPDVNGRAHILRVHMRKVPVSDDVNVKTLARGTPGFSGADLANLVNEAALLAARKSRKLVVMEDFEEAKDKVMMGAERRSMAMSDEERKLTAYHEAGHAIVALHCPQSDPIHKATIIPRGRALGMVMRLPEGDRLSVSKAKLLDDLRVAMGGRIAEEMIFGPDMVTTGASADIRMATDMATRMVTEWGMSDKLGMQAYAAPEQEVFLGHSVTQHKNISDDTLRQVDEEVNRILDETYADAKRILTENRDELDRLGEALLEYETLSGDDIKALLKGEPLNKPDIPEKPPKKRDDEDEDAAESKAKKGKNKPKAGGSVPSAGGLRPAE